MERKLATVLFVDLVDSTGLVTQTDPEVVRRRVNRFFEQASHCVEQHGGIVEKFAGDAVMAAFGVPQAHEDDAERAVRAALGILEATAELGLEARVGVEAGEVVVEDGDSTFATGEAVNLAARLQQAAQPGQILIGPATYRLTLDRIAVEDVGPLQMRGRAEPLWAWRATGAMDGAARLSRLEAALVGRDVELSLLENTHARVRRDRRAHVVTIFGDPGVGKSRLAREFLDTLEGTTVLHGRCLPYGEGITYWPLAEMVKVAAGIHDDEPVRAAFEKLRACCEDEAVADLLATASGVLEAVEGQRNQQEIAWAAREWSTRLADAQPLVLVFEDIHWGEEPLLELVEHLAEHVRDAPLLILCLARPELLEVRPSWGGGRLRSAAIELEPLAEDESELLIDALLAGTTLPPECRSDVLAVTEGNPLFVEETIRMLAEQDGSYSIGRIPDTLQALIAARIDRLPATEKRLLQRAALIGRIFWEGALGHLSPELDDVAPLLEELSTRELVLHEARSTISGERAYKFKHVLIRDVAYAGLSKSARAGLHARFAGWLKERAGEELLEIRAYNLDRAVELLTELDGAPPAELAAEAAAALAKAGKRALARDANRTARKLFLRAVEFEPTLERRYQAARAAWRLGDLGAVAVEMQRVREEAAAAGDKRLEGRALTALAHVALSRDGDVDAGKALADRAVSVLPEDDAEGLFDVLLVLGDTGWWPGDVARAEKHITKALAVARGGSRKDLESEGLAQLAWLYAMQLKLDEAEPLAERQLELAEESGRILARARAQGTLGAIRRLQGKLGAARSAYDEARRLYEEAGSDATAAWLGVYLGWIDWIEGDADSAEGRFRAAIKHLAATSDHSRLCEAQRALAEVLLAKGRIEEAERLALEARSVVSPQDVTSVPTTTMTLGLVRAAQGRAPEAEALLREAVAIYEETDFRALLAEPASALAEFLRERGRDDEAAELDPHVDALPGGWLGRVDARRAARTAAAV